MKYEDLEKATRLVSDIDEVNRVLNDLSIRPLTVKLFSNTNHIASYSPDANPADYPDMPIQQLQDFRNSLISHYTVLKDRLLKELEAL